MSQIDYELSKGFKHCIRHFVYYYTNGTLQYVIDDETILDGIDYREILKEEASLVEAVYAIYINNLVFDGTGTVSNHTHAMKRAAQYIKAVCVGWENYDPKFEDWETHLY